MPVLWREEEKVLCSKRCGLMPLSPSAPSPLLFSPSGQTVFMLLDEWKKERWNFYLLWRFSPRRNSKLNSICLDLKKQQMTKDNIQLFFLCFFFFNFVCFCHWNLSQTCLYEAERRERVRQILTGSPAERKQGDVHCWRACVRVHECVC